MEPLDQELKKRNREYAVGLDLTDGFSQVSVGPVDSDEIETVSVMPGQNVYQVPTALFKRAEVNQGFAGREADKYREAGGFYIDKLVTKARAGEDVTIGSESFRPSALLALYMKRILSLVNTVAPLSKVTSLMITVDTLDADLVTVLDEAVRSLGLKTKEVHFQSHMESFYNYMLFQPRELLNRDALLIDGTGEYIKSLRMECNKNTTPIVAFIDSHEDSKLATNDTEAPGYSAVFKAFTESVTEGHMISATFLIGDIFRDEWCHDSVTALCRKGRVFQGNNLFSKGACYAAKSGVSPSIINSGFVFLGNDKLKCNVGMNVSKRGEDAYLPLLDGGINWFDARNECEVILDKGNKLSFVITPLTGKNPETVDIILNDLPKRPPRTTRLNIKLKMQSETRIAVTVKDLGFGELFPAENIEWNEVISV